MDVVDYSRFFFALVFVIGLIWAVARAAKYFELDKKLRGVTGAAGRMQVADVLHLDPKRKMLLVRVDSAEYLLLITDSNAQLIATLGEKHEAA